MRFFVPFFAFLALVSAEVENFEFYGEKSQAMYSCAYGLYQEVIFGTGVYLPYCNNINGMASLMGCIAYEGRNTSDIFDFIINYCGKYYETTVTEKNLTDALAYYYEHAVPLESIENFNYSIPVTVPIKVNETRVDLFKDSYKVFLGNYDDSFWYGIGCVGYWFLIALISMVVNWSAILFPNLRNFFNGFFSKLSRKYVLMPALVKKKKSTSQRFLFIFDFLIPSRVESLVIFVFFWLVFILNAVGIYYVKNDPIFEESRTLAINRYVGDRTGIICTILIPLLVLLGGRNSFLQYLTRWKFTTVMAYHRWIARLVVLMAFIHSVAYTRIFIIEGYYAEDMAENYLIWGTVGTACGALICFQALLFLRRRWYETFLVLHILLAIFFLVGTWYHVWELGYGQIMYAAFVVWGFERLVRIIRLLAFGFPKAEISLISDETIKVVVPKPSYWSSIPGGHAWLYFGGIMFWQAHPFTLIEEDGAIKFYCKVKGGVTKSLYKKLIKVPGKKLSVRVGVEGPYGESHPIKHHSSAVFVAGGSGIPGLYSELKDLADKNPHSKQVLKLVWIIREIKSLAWFYSELQALKNTNVETTIYITRPEDVNGIEELGALISATSDSDSQEKSEKVVSSEILDQVARDLQHVKFLEGRPNLEGMIATEIGEAANSTAFVTCGHPAMVDEVRYVVVRSIEKTNKRVDFYEALEIWA